MTWWKSRQLGDINRKGGDRTMARSRLVARRWAACLLVGGVMWAIQALPLLTQAQPSPGGSAIVMTRPAKITQTEARQLQQLFARQASRKRVVTEHTFRVNLTEFGSCFFVPTIDLSRGAPKLVLHLVKNNRVIYTFPQPTWVQPWTINQINAVGFMELNFDGGDGDIVLIADYVAGASGPGTSPPFPVVMVYLTEQRRYDLDDEISRILTDRKVRTVAQAETIMRQEFQYLP